MAVILRKKIISQNILLYIGRYHRIPMLDTYIFISKVCVKAEKLDKHFKQVLHVGGQSQHDLAAPLVGNGL